MCWVSHLIGRITLSLLWTQYSLIQILRRQRFHMWCFWVRLSQQGQVPSMLLNRLSTLTVILCVHAKVHSLHRLSFFRFKQVILSLLERWCGLKIRSEARAWLFRDESKCTTWTLRYIHRHKCALINLLIIDWEVIARHILHSHRKSSITVLWILLHATTVCSHPV